MSSPISHLFTQHFNKKYRQNQSRVHKQELFNSLSVAGGGGGDDWGTFDNLVLNVLYFIFIQGLHINIVFLSGQNHF